MKGVWDEGQLSTGTEQGQARGADADLQRRHPACPPSAFKNICPSPPPPLAATFPSIASTDPSSSTQGTEHTSIMRAYWFDNLPVPPPRAPPPTPFYQNPDRKRLITIANF